MAMNKFFRIPFATSGDKVAVPDDSQPSGSVSYTDGFGPDYELDPGVDPAAKDVPRDESNQLYFDITTAIKEYQEFGVPDFITSALNGGAPFSYSKYARVKWTDNAVYESRVNTNTSDPSNATNWRKITDNIDYLTIATTAFQASVTDGKAVYWDGTQFDEAIANGTSAQNVIGFADVSNGRVFVAGLYAGQLSGLTANVSYYLSASTPGAISSVFSAVRMGVARTATSFFVSISNGNSLATETAAGIAEIATQAETNARTNDTNFVTPLKIGSGFGNSNSGNGYVKLPNWLGGVVFQWGIYNAGTLEDTNATITFPLTFPSACAAVFGTAISTANITASNVTSTATQVLSVSQFRLYGCGSIVPTAYYWFAVGF